MVVVGADVHKRTHTFVAVDEVGRKLGEKVVPATTSGHAEAVMWARERSGRRWCGRLRIVGTYRRAWNVT
jgi:transposase